MVLEGFLEKEEKVEDRGLGVGSLSRDFTVGMCPSYLVTWEEHSWVSEGFQIQKLCRQQDRPGRARLADSGL